MKKLLAVVLLLAMLFSISASGEGGDYVKTEHAGISFELNSAYALQEKESSAVITLEEKNAFIVIINTEFGSLAETMLPIWPSMTLSDFEPQNLEEGELDLGLIPARYATCIAKVSGRWFSAMVVSLVVHDTLYTLSFYGSPDAIGDYSDEFAHILESIQPLPLGEERKAELSEDHLTRLEDSLAITKLTTSKPTSKGGVTLSIAWTNKSDDTIDTITFYATPLNADGEPVESEKDGKSTACLELSKSYKKGKKTDSKFKDVWFNKEIVSARIDKIEIEYDDLSTTTINGSYFDYQWIK